MGHHQHDPGGQGDDGPHQAFPRDRRRERELGRGQVVRHDYVPGQDGKSGRGEAQDHHRCFGRNVGGGPAKLLIHHRAHLFGLGRDGDNHRGGILMLRFEVSKEQDLTYGTARHPMPFTFLKPSHHLGSTY